jgi:hypothetical protein
MAKRISKRFVTGEVRLTFVSVKDPMSFEDNKEPKFRVTLLAPKGSDAAKGLKNAVDSLIEEAKDTIWDGKIPHKMWNPYRDGLEKEDDYPEFEGNVFINAKSDYRPGCVLKDLSPIPLDSLDSEIYSGVYARVCITLFPYANSKGGAGITVYLNSIQKIRDGEKIETSSNNPANDFQNDYSSLV